MPSAKEAIDKISSHERECSIRYQNIEKRLDRGAVKFDAMDTKFTRYIFGLYVLIIVAAGVDRIFS
jgi:hypothetical protein|tara:strand:- start:542 stop:739 length:198 start_codon:yes stop_codon:yes gene_type:complete